MATRRRHRAQIEMPGRRDEQPAAQQELAAPVPMRSALVLMLTRQMVPAELPA